MIVGVVGASKNNIAGTRKAAKESIFCLFNGKHSFSVEGEKSGFVLATKHQNKGSNLPVLLF